MQVLAFILQLSTVVHWQAQKREGERVSNDIWNVATWCRYFLTCLTLKSILRSLYSSISTVTPIYLFVFSQNKLNIFSKEEANAAYVMVAAAAPHETSLIYLQPHFNLEPQQGSNVHAKVTPHSLLTC